MQSFAYIRARHSGDAVLLETAAPEAAFIAGGTTLLDLMKLGVMAPQSLVDINDLAPEIGDIEAGAQGLRLGALAHMTDAAEHPDVLRDYPVIAQSLQQAASAQLRNMATLGGNVLQRTRCVYYRDTRWSACNKRDPGSGCSALEGVTRKHAVLGASDACIATYPGDFAQALVALGAEVETIGPNGARRIAFEDLHTDSSRPEVESILEPGELIARFHVPAGPWTRRSLYVKVRDRQSYEFGLATAAVALDLEGARVREARIGLGGVAYKPWRAHEAEAILRDRDLTPESALEAARAAFAGAQGRGGNDYKITLGQRTLARALLEAQKLEI